MSPVDQYAAATTESLARLAVEQAASLIDDAEQDTRDYGDTTVHADDNRRTFESLVRCVDELARRVLAGERR